MEDIGKLLITANLNLNISTELGQFVCHFLYQNDDDRKESLHLL